MIHLCTILEHLEHTKNTPSPCLSVEVVANLEAGGWRRNGDARCPLVDVNAFYISWVSEFKAEYPITILAVTTTQSEHGLGCLLQVKKETLSTDAPTVVLVVFN